MPNTTTTDEHRDWLEERIANATPKERRSLVVFLISECAMTDKHNAEFVLRYGFLP